jgi:predicted ArsR family transcriptional regulator
MHPTRQAIVRALKLRGHTTVNDLADLVGIKAITVRHHLHSLQADGFIEMSEHRQSVGRPLHYYSLACPYVSWGKRHVEKCEIDTALIASSKDADLPDGACLLAGDSACAYNLQSA